ncbi:MAG: ParB/RepB/Spo0J family partition protein [Trueperella sp.]|nr:ParB/RepB/Spo0J family partition protein [Trueperella sp.]
MATKRRGLGRGIGALFPPEQEEPKERPIDVFFGGKADNRAEKTIDQNIDSVADQGESPVKAPQKPTKPASTAKPKTSAKKRSSGAGATKSSATKAVTAADEELLAIPGATFGEIPLEQIVPNTKQPRQVFDEDELTELADSIREVGVLQPIVVRALAEPVADNPTARYELIMGERRWRASQLAGNTSVPAIVRHTEDSDLLRDALLENLHRTQLNPLEEAAAYQQLLHDFNCTQEELSQRIARSRPQISNTLRLLKLPPLVQRRVAAGVLSAGHARALLGLTDPADMERIAQRIVAEGLSVRAVEEIVALGDDVTPTRRRTAAKQYETELDELATKLSDWLDTRVKVQLGTRKGRITVEFANLSDMNRILQIWGENPVIPEDPTAESAE